MGQTLSEPVTAKETSSCENTFVKVASSCMQGWRINMEDAHTHLLAVPEDKNTCFFAVFDGHGGAKVAQYAGAHLHKKIVQSEAYSKGDIEEAIRFGFLLLDEEMTKDDQVRGETVGTTAVVVIIKNNKIYCGNVGDSRAVASVSGLAEALSFDHKPANDTEARRIYAAGGWIDSNRVNGNLALSRALGDFIYKRNDEKPPQEQIVTAYPDVTVRDLTPNDEFILLACDGIWDVLSNQEAIDFCRDRLATGQQPETICEELLSRCLAPDSNFAGLGCDNMTAVLVCLLNGRSWAQYCEVLKQPRPPTPPPQKDDVLRRRQPQQRDDDDDDEQLNNGGINSKLENVDMVNKVENMKSKTKPNHVEIASAEVQQSLKDKLKSRKFEVVLGEPEQEPQDAQLDNRVPTMKMDFSDLDPKKLHDFLVKGHSFDGASCSKEKQDVTDGEASYTTDVIDTAASVPTTVDTSPKHQAKNCLVTSPSSKASDFKPTLDAATTDKISSSTNNAASASSTTIETNVG